MNPMKYLFYFAFLFCTHFLKAQPNPVLHGKGNGPDWLITPIKQKATISQKGDSIILDNGLLKRVFQVKPNVACIDFTNTSSGQQLLRSIEPEAKVTIDLIEYQVGGLHGQTEKAYLKKEGAVSLFKKEADFFYVKHTITPIQPFINWKPTTWLLDQKQPTGQQIVFEYFRVPRKRTVNTLHTLMTSNTQETITEIFLFPGEPKRVKKCCKEKISADYSVEKTLLAIKITYLLVHIR